MHYVNNPVSAGCVRLLSSSRFSVFSRFTADYETTFHRMAILKTKFSIAYFCIVFPVEFPYIFVPFKYVFSPFFLEQLLNIATYYNIEMFPDNYEITLKVSY